MSGLTPAKAGDRLTLKAIRVLSKGGRRSIQSLVGPKTPGAEGRWVDIDDGYVADNNLMAGIHAEDFPKHRWAWWNTTTGDLEVP